jgi:hypothetical protein
LLAFNLSKSMQSTMIHPVVANDSAVIQGPPSAAVRDNESLVASDDLDGNVSDGQNGVTTGMLLELHGTRDVESQSPVLVARLGAASLAGALTALRLDAQSGSGLNSLLIVLVCLTALILSAAAIFVLVTNHRFSLTQLRTEIMNRAFPPPVSPVVATPSPSPRPQPQRFVVAESASSEEPLSQISETTEHFAARLEEIIEQLSQMLKGTMRTYPKSTADTGGTDARTWWYVAALPGSTTSQTTISHGLVKWSSGRLGWWPNIDAFHANDSPIGSVPLGKITGITNEDADPTVVVVVAESEPDRIFQFQTWKEAKTWASTLAALIEQLHDEN